MIPTAIYGEWVPCAELLVPSAVTSVALSDSCQSLLLCLW